MVFCRLLLPGQRSSVESQTLFTILNKNIQLPAKTNVTVQGLRPFNPCASAGVSPVSVNCLLLLLSGSGSLCICRSGDQTPGERRQESTHNKVLSFLF